jgi:hypothetical protein
LPFGLTTVAGDPNPGAHIAMKIDTRNVAEAANTDGEISAAANAAESVRSVVFMSILLLFCITFT